MAIKIKRNEDANAIVFENSTFPIYHNSAITAEVDAGDNTLVNIKDTFSKSGNDIKMYRIPFSEFIDENDNSFADAATCVAYINEKANIPRAEILRDSATYTQGYYSLLTDFYFTAGTPTLTNIGVDDVNEWVDLNFTVAPNNSNEGLFDYRPVAMVEAQATGHTGTGTQVDPIIFLLEGLDLRSFASFRASLTFEPETDEGQFDARLLFTRHSGTTPSTDFDITETVMTMVQGADIEYFAEPFLSFFVGDSIDTNGAGDAGTFKFQVRSNVQGDVRLRAFSLYINK